MNIYITFDYELFFGRSSGSAEKCLIEPSEELMEIAEKNGCKFVFFVDAGYLCKLNELYKKNQSLDKDRNYVLRQLDNLVKRGHSLQLHVHPHWEDTHFTDNGWDFDLSRFRLHEFNDAVKHDIIKRYKKIIMDIGGDVFAYRAGGWCLQPFSELQSALASNDIWLDSTMIKGAYSSSITHYYDYRNAPPKDMWKFSNDPMIEDPNGQFIELPISSVSYSSSFYWKFAYTKLLAGVQHKIYGDGNPVGSSHKDRFRFLTKRSVGPVSCDGYRAGMIHKEYARDMLVGKSEFVIIGHPKAASRYSLTKLNDFLRNNIENVVPFSRSMRK